MLLDSVTHRFQDVAVLDHIVVVVVTGDNTRGSPVASPQRILVRNLFPLILFLVTGIHLVARDIGKPVSGLIEFFKIVETVKFFLNQLSTLYVERGENQVVNMERPCFV
jgi:hypothetical protein